MTVNLGWSAQTDVLPSGDVRVTGWARVLADDAPLPKGCIAGELPTRSAQWDFTLKLAPDQTVTRDGGNGFRLTVRRLADLNSPG